MRQTTFVLALTLLTAAGCIPDEDTVQTQDTDGPDAVVNDARSADAVDAGGDLNGSDTWNEPAPRPVTEAGPYHIGYSELEVTYQADQDQTDEPRNLDVSLWYPTTTDDGPPAEYTIFLDREKVVQGAEPAPLQEMPMLVFSHGNGGIRQQNYFMAEFWASHGWTVVSPGHTGNTVRSGTDINIEAAVYRPQDITAVLDRIDNLADDHPLAGRLSDTIAMSGHSFGGYTTLANAGASYAVDELLEGCEAGEVSDQYCEVFQSGDRAALFRGGFRDERIDLAIPLAPAGNLIFQKGLEDLDVPTMLFTGGMDRTLPNEEEGDPIWRQMSGQQHRRNDLPMAGHFTFSNMCDFEIVEDEDRVQGDGCSDEFIEPMRAYDIINTYSLAFARYHLLGDDGVGPIVDGEEFPIGRDGFELSVGTK